VTLSDPALDRLRAAASAAEAPGRYELRGEIARGGMGIVYAAFDRELEREVALKVVGAGGSAGDLRLLREARVLARLEHPGLVPVHDVGTLADGRTFYAMKWVRGSRLDRHFAGEPSIPVRLRTFERILQTVAFAHAHGVIHRDLKPENVMVGPFGEVLVIDWGVARLRDRGETEGAVLGTPGYMAPEQARGESGVGVAADVYALGALLSFLAGDERPRAVSAMITRARAPRAEDRYPSVAELQDDVARFLSGGPVSAYAEGPVETVRRLATKYRTPLVLVAAYLVMRVLLAVVARV